MPIDHDILDALPDEDQDTDEQWPEIPAGRIAFREALHLRLELLAIARAELGVEQEPLTQHEIAEIIGVSRSTIHNQQSAALRKLRAQLRRLERR